jgi:hypothetical protein
MAAFAASVHHPSRLNLLLRVLRLGQLEHELGLLHLGQKRVQQVQMLFLQRRARFSWGSIRESHEVVHDMNNRFSGSSLNFSAIAVFHTAGATLIPMGMQLNTRMPSGVYTFVRYLLLSSSSAYW